MACKDGMISTKSDCRDDRVVLLIRSSNILVRAAAYYFTRMFEPRHNILSNVRTNVRKYIVTWFEHSRESNRTSNSNSNSNKSNSISKVIVPGPKIYRGIGLVTQFVPHSSPCLVREFQLCDRNSVP